MTTLEKIRYEMQKYLEDECINEDEAQGIFVCIDIIDKYASEECDRDCEHCAYLECPKEPCEDAVSDIMGISKGRTHDIMENELRCVQRASNHLCDRECDKCDLLEDTDEIIKAYGYVIRTLELPSVQPKAKTGRCCDCKYFESAFMPCNRCRDNSQFEPAVQK